MPVFKIGRPSSSLAYRAQVGVYHKPLTMDELMRHIDIGGSAAPSGDAMF